MNSFTPSLYKDILTKVSIKYSGPDILVAIFYFIYTVSNATIYDLKDNLKVINLSDYIGDNLKKFYQDIKKICSILQGGGGGGVLGPYYAHIHLEYFQAFQGQENGDVVNHLV